MTRKLRIPSWARLAYALAIAAMPASADATAAGRPAKASPDTAPAPHGPATPNAAQGSAPAAPAYARRLASAPVLYGDFAQSKQIHGIKKPLASQGDFLVSQGKGVIWRTRKPFASAVAVTAKGLWALEGGDSAKAPRKAPIHQGNLGATLAMIERVLSGDPAGLEKSFSVVAGGTDSAWTLRLTPKDPAWGRFVRSLELSGGAHVDSVAYLEANGDRTRIAFTGVREGAGDLAAWAAAAFRD